MGRVSQTGRGLTRQHQFESACLFLAVTCESDALHSAHRLRTAGPPRSSPQEAELMGVGVGEAMDEAEVLQREFAGVQVRCHLMPQQAEQRATEAAGSLLSTSDGSATRGF